jgi:eukaryotic-like serine/threonine-protein kinase
MMGGAGTLRLIRFEAFEADLETGELRRHGVRVRLPDQSFQILTMLLERPGKLVSREEIQKRLWPNDTVVEFESSINAAIRRLRMALDDSAEEPHFIETLPRRGYRWMAPVEWVTSVSEAETSDGASQPIVETRETVGHFLGQRVAHYRVMEILGGGGMGVVYGAEDLKLGRRVALKFLPEELAEDQTALERFEREARTASALNHPNICTIHEVEEHEGQPFIVMELLEGETLRERIAATTAAASARRGQDRGGLPIGEVLDLALQIVSGLKAAHEKGVIHRDIKPANIFITTTGQAKILDFGLAKLTAVAPVSAPAKEAGDEDIAATAPARTTAADPHLTLTGVAMGTAPYMSPEQARGEELDARTDLFSFGAVLYEMATGRQPFVGETAAIVREAILNRTPTPAKELNPEVPPELQEIINKALRKERELRYQLASEIRDDLNGLMRVGSSGRAEASRTHRYGKAELATAALMVMLAGFAWFLLRRPSRPSAELAQKRLTFNSSENAVESAVISPDGKYLAYSDPAGIRVKLLSGGDERLIPRPAGLPADASWFLDSWFPDGTQLLADTRGPGPRHGMWTISVLGQSLRELREGARAWEVSPDGTRIAFSPVTPSGEFREIWVTGGHGENPQKILTLGQNENLGHDYVPLPTIAVGQKENLWHVHWSPDGQRLAYTTDTTYAANWNRWSLETCDLKGAKRTVVVSSSDLALNSFCWLPGGRIIYSRQESPASNDFNLWQIRVGIHSGEPTDEPQRITDWTASNPRQMSTSADRRRLVVLKQTDQGEIYIARLTAGGTRMNPPRQLINDGADDQLSAWTADGKAVLFDSNHNGKWGIFKQEIGKDTAEALVTGPEDTFYPRLSPDGAWILYQAIPKRPSIERRLMRASLNGGVPEPVLQMRNVGSVSSYSCARAPASRCVISEESQDAKQLVVTAFDPLRGGGKVLRTIEKAPTDSYHGRLSPDGSTFAIWKTFGSEIHIRLLSLTGGSDREINVKGRPNVVGTLDWSADGKGLYYGSVSTRSSTLLYVDLKGNARALWQFKGSGFGKIEGIPSPNGRYVAIGVRLINSNVWMLENF